MPTRTRNKRELPPTAGLPLLYADFYRSPARSLGQGLRHWLGIPEPIITCSGTAALILALHTLAKRLPGRTDIIVPAYTCPLVALTSHFIPGTRIIPCDLLPESIDLDPERLRSLCGDRTLAVVVTHLGGQVADVEQASVIAGRCGAAVIEDAAQAMGARCRGKSVGLRGDVGFFSLAVGKGLTMYEGGVLFSRNPELHAELAASASERLGAGLYWNGRRILELLGYAALYRPDRLRRVYGEQLRARLDAGDAIGAVGDDFTLADIPLHRPDRFRMRAAANALERLPAFLQDGRQRAAKRAALLEAPETVRIITSGPKNSGVWPFFMALMPTEQRRDAAMNALWRTGLGVSRLFIHALPDYPYLAPFLPQQTDCPAAREFASRMLTVSNSPWLDEASFQAVADALQATG